MTDIQTNDIAEDGECSHVRCDEVAEVAAVCDTGQVIHYCPEHGGGRSAGHALVEEWREL